MKVLLSQAASVKPIGQMLRERGLVSEEDLNNALALQKERRHKIGKILVDLGYVAERDMEKREYIAFNIATNTASVTWHSIPVKGLNLPELKEMRRLKLINEKGYTLIGIKAIAPSNGTINTDLLETLWQIDPTKIFEALAEYQSRDIAHLYLENITIEWVEMPPYLSREKLSDRKGMYRQHGFLYHAMRVDNPSGTLTQAIKLSHLEADWKLKPADSIRYLKRLTQLDVIKADLSQLNITWYW